MHTYYIYIYINIAIISNKTAKLWKHFTAFFSFFVTQI